MTTKGEGGGSKITKILTTWFMNDSLIKRVISREWEWFGKCNYCRKVSLSVIIISMMKKIRLVWWPIQQPQQDWKTGFQYQIMNIWDEKQENIYLSNPMHSGKVLYCNPTENLKCFFKKMSCDKYFFRSPYRVWCKKNVKNFLLLHKFGIGWKFA